MTRSTHSGHHRAPGPAPTAAAPRAQESGEAGYRGPVAAAAAGITYRQLDHWARAGLVQPSARTQRPDGGRLYHAGDVLVLTVVRRLLEAGVCLQQVRATTLVLREHTAGPLVDAGALASLTLMCDGATVYPCTCADEVIELVQGGQGVFGIAVGPVWEQVRAALAASPTEGGPRALPGADELTERHATRANG